MAWNPSPKVAAARDLWREFGAAQVIVLLIDRDKGTLETVSYGATRALCEGARRLAQVAYEAVWREEQDGGNGE